MLFSSNNKKIFYHSYSDNHSCNIANKDWQQMPTYHRARTSPLNLNPSPPPPKKKRFWGKDIFPVGTHVMPVKLLSLMDMKNYVPCHLLFSMLYPYSCIVNNVSRRGSGGEGGAGDLGPLTPQFRGPNFCHCHASAALCRQNLACPPPPLHKSWIRTFVSVSDNWVNWSTTPKSYYNVLSSLSEVISQ